VDVDEVAVVGSLVEREHTVEQFVRLRETERPSDARRGAVAAGDHARLDRLHVARGRPDLDDDPVVTLVDADDRVVLSDIGAGLTRAVGESAIESDAVDHVRDGLGLIKRVRLRPGATDVEARAVHPVLEEFVAGVVRDVLPYVVRDVSGAGQRGPDRPLLENDDIATGRGRAAGEPRPGGPAPTTTKSCMGAAS